VSPAVTLAPFSQFFEGLALPEIRDMILRLQEIERNRQCPSKGPDYIPCLLERGHEEPHEGRYYNGRAHPAHTAMPQPATVTWEFDA
jgi:hypothetical protein